jgi:UDP-N-acetylglucosamine 2-epimerase (hydrolysing)
MNSATLPSINEVRQHYSFNFTSYAILMFHPVTSEYSDMRRQISTLVDQVITSKLNYILIYPNNDYGSDIILDEYSRLEELQNIKLYPSMRFEYFLTLLKYADFIIGNSSAGVREAPHFGVPSINLGSRQNNRVKCNSVLDVTIGSAAISHAIAMACEMPRQPRIMFGNGNSAALFHSVLKNPLFWERDTQKYFVDRIMKRAE